jgi:addiction module RelE/StbE family toxin
MKLTKTEFYSKREKAFLKSHIDLLDKYKKVLKKLAVNPFDASLKTHKLKGELKKFYGCSINYEYRIVFVMLIQNDEITLLDIGTHDEVY